MSRIFPDVDMVASAARSETVLPAFSFAFWFNMNSPLGGPANLFGYPLFSDESFFLLFYNTDTDFPGYEGVATLAWQDTTQAGAANGTTVFGLPSEGTWFHFAGTLDYAGDKKFHLYLNGVEMTDFKFPSDAGLGTGIDFTPTGGNPYPIGWCFGSDEVDSFALDGFIEDARLWSVGLTASEILQVSQGSNVRYNDLIGWWKFCGEDNPELDSSINNNPMILSTPEPLAGPHATVNICALAIGSLSVASGFSQTNDQRTETFYGQLTPSSPTDIYPAGGFPFDSILLQALQPSTQTPLRVLVWSVAGSGYIYQRVSANGKLMVLQVPPKGSLTTAAPLQQLPSSSDSLSGVYNDVIQFEATYARNA